jgi:integrase
LHGQEVRGGFLHLGNWRQRVFKPACARAGLEGVISYNGRDTFASLLIYEGRPPILVAAALGHGDTQTLWRLYASPLCDAHAGPAAADGLHRVPDGLVRLAIGRAGAKLACIRQIHGGRD